MIHHLHISTAFLPDDFPSENMKWRIMADPRYVKLEDPLAFMDIRFTVDEKISGVDIKKRL